MIPQRSLSRVSSENGVSSRVEACRKRLRLIRADHKTQLEAGPDDVSIACGDETHSELSRSHRAIKAQDEELDEAGIT